MPAKYRSDEVLRLTGKDFNDPTRRQAWSNLVAALGLEPKCVRERVLLTNDDQHGYRLHLSIKIQTADGKDILDRAADEIASEPRIFPLTPDQVTAVLEASR